MIHEVSEWDHHGGWQCPSEAPGAREVIHEQEQVLRIAREKLTRVPCKNWLDLGPFGFNLSLVKLGVHLELFVHELGNFLGGPVADQV